MSEGRPRVGVIGARRRRLGVGEYLARFVHEEGGRVVALVGTTFATVAEARANLSRLGIEANGYLSAESMIEREELDAVVIASPASFHEHQLRLALRADLDVLCEKPLIWRPEGSAGAAARLVERFTEKGRHLEVNTQWRFTLDAYRQLFPEVDVFEAAYFQMRMSPASRGNDMLVDAIPHAVSLVAAADRRVGRPQSSASGDGELQGTVVVSSWNGPEHVEVGFGYPPRSRRVSCRVVLDTCMTQPRPASYSFGNSFEDVGPVAHRVIREPGYRQSLRDESGTREIAYEDPMRRLVRDFVAAVSSGTFSPSPSLVQEVDAVESIVSGGTGPIGPAMRVVGGGEGG